MTPTSEYCSIPLTRGQSAIVDAADYEWLIQWKWHALWCRCAPSFYAARHVRIDGRKKIVLMHRLILGLDFGDKRRGDHKNMNSLDNRRSNLRIATHQQNLYNRRMMNRNTSGYKGVTWDKQHNRWCAQIVVQRRRVWLGRFDTAEAAYAAYCEAALRLHGEFARMA